MESFTLRRAVPDSRSVSYEEGLGPTQDSPCRLGSGQSGTEQVPPRVFLFSSGRIIATMLRTN